jgi:hypothetical protein
MLQDTSPHIQNIIAPKGVAFWPPQPGWYVVLLVLLILVVIFITIRIRHNKRNAYRSQGILALEALKNKAVSDSNILKVNSILKACALQAYSREDIAIFSSENWVAFLNKKAKPVNFSGAFKTILISGHYEKFNSETFSQNEFDDLITLSVKWVKKHRHI